MKRLVSFFVILLIPLCVFSQYQDPNKDQKKTVSNDNSYPVYFQIGTGIDHYTGLFGLGAEVNFAGNFSALGDVGLGGIGLKASVGVRYYHHYPKGVFYGLGISHTTGIDSMQVKLETANSNGKAVGVPIKINPLETVNLSMGYVWTLGSRLRLNLEVGYAVLVQSKPYKVLDPKIQLNDVSKLQMKWVVPGGLLLGLGFSVGLK